MAKSKRREENFRIGILFFLGFTVFIPFVDAGAKLLILEGYHPSFVTWGRFTSSALLIVPFLLIQRVNRPMALNDKIAQIARALFIVLATFLFFSSLKTTRLADAIGILFTYPLIITLLAPIFLGENAGKRRWFAVFVGFFGALLIVRPLSPDFQIGYLYALGSSVCFATFSLVTRRLSQAFEPITILSIQVFVGAVVMTPFLSISWKMPSIFALAIFLAIGLISLIAHIMLILAYRSTPAPVLAPYGYFEIVMAAILGFLMFNEVPDNLTWVGIIIVMASGVYTSIREMRGIKRNS